MELNDDNTFDLVRKHFLDEQVDNVPVCQDPDCDESAIACEIDPETHEYFCPYHAAENGFCCCCGIFIAGWRDFSDMCENCELDAKSNYSDDDEEDQFDDYYEF